MLTLGLPMWRIALQVETVFASRRRSVRESFMVAGLGEGGGIGGRRMGEKGVVVYG